MENDQENFEENKEENNKITNFYWKPLDEVKNFLINYCKQNNYKEILEIGPGIEPFELATKFVGCNEKIKEYIDLDIDTNQLPFDDNSIDFVYSRHTLEDIQNPDFAMKEIIRVSKSGYIETPSPLIEITKGVDSFDTQQKYSGYIHHRYIVWSDIEKCEIYFLPKYNSILDHIMTSRIDKAYYENKYYWNNYFLWNEDEEPKIIMYKNGVNFGMNKRFIEDYIKLLFEAVNKSIENTDKFIQKIMT